MAKSKTTLSTIQNTPQNNEDFIDKVDKYVTLNNETFQYSISSTAKTALTTEEFILASNIITNTNQNIAELKNRSSLVISNKSVKTVRRITRSINTSRYWDIDYFWWGPRIFLHHNLIRDMQHYANTTVVFSTGGPAMIATAVLSWIGVSSSVVTLGAPVLAAALGASVYDRIIDNDNGSGVYIDINQFWTPGTKIYPAW